MADSEIDRWFESSPPAQRAALAQLRDLIKAAANGSIEEMKWGRPCYSSKAGLFCYLNRARSHVVIGFQRGAVLSDPEHLLEGTGKEMRHIKFRESADVDRLRGPILAILQQAAKQ